MKILLDIWETPPPEDLHIAHVNFVFNPSPLQEILWCELDFFFLSERELPFTSSHLWGVSRVSKIPKIAVEGITLVTTLYYANTGQLSTYLPDAEA